MFIASFCMPPGRIGMPFAKAKKRPTIVIIIQSISSHMGISHANNKNSGSRAKTKFISTPPALYQKNGTFSGVISGGDIKHCPPVPANLNRLILIFPSLRINATLAMRNEMKRYPVANPIRRCPPSWRMICRTMATNMAMKAPSIGIINSTTLMSASLSTNSDIPSGPSSIYMTPTTATPPMTIPNKKDTKNFTIFFIISIIIIVQM